MKPNKTNLKTTDLTAGILILLIGVVVFITALAGSLTGASLVSASNTVTGDSIKDVTGQQTLLTSCTRDSQCGTNKICYIAPGVFSGNCVTSNLALGSICPYGNRQCLSLMCSNKMCVQPCSGGPNIQGTCPSGQVCSAVSGFCREITSAQVRWTFEGGIRNLYYSTKSATPNIQNGRVVIITQESGSFFQITPTPSAAGAVQVLPGRESTGLPLTDETYLYYGRNATGQIAYQIYYKDRATGKIVPYQNVIGNPSEAIVFAGVLFTGLDNEHLYLTPTSPTPFAQNQDLVRMTFGYTRGVTQYINNVPHAINFYWNPSVQRYELYEIEGTDFKFVKYKTF